VKAEEQEERCVSSAFLLKRPSLRYSLQQEIPLFAGIQRKDRVILIMLAVRRGATGCICQSTAWLCKMWVVARLLLPCDTGSGNPDNQSHEKTSYLKPLPH